MDATRTYYLTTDPQDANRRFLHTEGCQVRQNHLEDVIELGDFADCARALAHAHQDYPNANACALCCPDCHMPYEDVGAAETRG